MNSIVKVGTLIFWAVGIGSEFVIQKWPHRKKLLNIIAAFAFVLALAGEFMSFHFDEQRETYWENRLHAIGTPTTEWFNAKDAKSQVFNIKHDPLPGSLEVDINGLEEPTEIYSLRDHEVTVSTPMDHTDQVIIKYRYAEVFH
jgi:hypothetical protein